MFNMKKIEDEGYRHNLIRSLARQKMTPATVNLSDGKVLGAYLCVNRTTINPTIKIEEQYEFKKDDEIDITFFVKDFFLLFNTSILNRLGENEYEIFMPSVIYSSFRRIISRHIIEEEEEAFVYLPVTEEKLRIKDINTMGMSFVAETVLFRDTGRIDGLCVMLGTSTKVIVDAEIIYCITDKNGKYIYGLKFVDLDWTHNHELFTYVFNRKYPHLRSLGDFKAEEVYQLFAEYLKKKPKEEIDANFKEMMKRLKMIHKNHDISANLAFYSDDRLLSTASALRIYDNTFLGHQLVSIPEAIMNIKSKTSIYYGLSEFLMNHISFDYYLSYFFTNVTWHIEMFIKIAKFIDDKHKFIVDTVQFYECDTGMEYILPDNYECKRVDDVQEFLEYCKTNLSQLETECYCYTEDGIMLDEISNVYAKAGLDIKRFILKVTWGEKVVAYAVSEIYSDGLNLFNLTDMTRLYYFDINSSLDDIIITVTHAVKDYYIIHGKKKFNLVFSGNDTYTRLIAPGIKLSDLPWGRIMANRDGGSEYWKMIMMNFK